MTTKTFVRTVLCAALFGMPAVAEAQRCTRTANPFFEFQVDRAARFIPDATHPHPAAGSLRGMPSDPDVPLVEFTVDTAGVPIASTFDVIRTPSRAFADSAKRVMTKWRFVPARLGACPVEQLVQTILDR